MPVCPTCNQVVDDELNQKKCLRSSWETSVDLCRINFLGCVISVYNYNLISAIRDAFEVYIYA